MTTMTMTMIDACDDEACDDPPPNADAAPAGSRALMAAPVAVAPGKPAARRCTSVARALRMRASACCSVGLAAKACAISCESCASPSASHQAAGGGAAVASAPSARWKAPAASAPGATCGAPW
jgi:hypothetical protein